MKPDYVSIRHRLESRQIPSRYRLGHPKFSFSVRDGRLFESNAGIFPILLTNCIIVGQPPPPNDQRSSAAVYLRNDGRPADELSKSRLHRDMVNNLCVIRCRLAVDSCDERLRDDDPAAWERCLSLEGMPPELPRLTGGGFSSHELESLEAEQRHRQTVASTKSRRRCSLEERPQSGWERAVLCRLSLFLGLPRSNPRLMRLASYYHQGGDFRYWEEDKELQPFIDSYKRDGQLGRLISILDTIAYRRSGRQEEKSATRKPLDFYWRVRRRRFFFRFPPVSAVRGIRAKRSKKAHIGIDFAKTHYFQDGNRESRWVAAAVYLAQEYLVEPKSWAGRHLTQEAMATRFGITRRQLTHALFQITDDAFQQRVWDTLQARLRSQRLARPRAQLPW